MRYVKVKKVNNDNRVALWEKHAAHPRGEVFIAAPDMEFVVAETQEVSERTSSPRLLEVVGYATDAEVEAARQSEPVEKQTAQESQPKPEPRKK